jgi:DNA polymerase
VLLGATAAQALLGTTFRVTRERGQRIERPDLGLPPMVATIHPSAVLRAPDDARDETYDGLVADLRAAAAWLTGREPGGDR